MIAPLEKVKGMPLIPHHCVLCSNNPCDEITGEQLEAIFAPGVDYDWGSSAYVCKSCVELMADLFGRVTVEGFDKLTEKYEALSRAHEKLQKKHARQEELLARVRDGGSAIKKLRREAVS